jgi:phage shock protein PspC (stress-responsive transcriptional regulator)
MTDNAFPPRAQVPPYKQLRRPTTDRIVAGVCSGLGRYFDLDPVLIRVLFAVSVVLTGGLALIAYPVMWFVMPEEPTSAPAWPSQRPVYTPPTYTPAGPMPATAPVPPAATGPVPPAGPMPTAGGPAPTPSATPPTVPPAPPSTPPAPPAV